jgi:hypothetical protein
MSSGSVVLPAMDIVVITPHGDADVSIVEHGPDATLADLLAMVTGQAVPLLADLDGHPVSCSTALGEAGLAMGSVVTTEPAQPEPATQSEIALIQLTGSGSGRSVRLDPGRFRIGPGRRLSADELLQAPVETGAFELTVDASDSRGETGARTRVQVTPADLRPLLLDAEPVESATPWGEEFLTAANRVFLLDVSPPSTASRSVPAPDADGFISFHRPPRRQPRAGRRPVIDAVNDAACATAELWAQRSGRKGAFVVPVGMRSTEDRPTEATLDLARSSVVAVIGHERFRTSMARTIMVELATLHGPADLDIAIIPAPDQSAAWEWAKWLPHVRLGGDPMIHRDRRAVTDWAAGVSETTWGAGHLTLVVVDDPAQWTAPGAPLRELMATAPDGLRVLALCERERDAPSGAEVMITGSDHGSARLDELDHEAGVVEFLPSLIETDLARSAAQHLAPLLDIEIQPRSAGVPTDGHPGTNGDLVRFLGLASVTADEIMARWNSADGGSKVAVGYQDEQLVTLDLDEVGDVLVTGATIDDALDCAATIALGLASIHPPGALWTAAVTADLYPQLQALARLPHAAPSTDTQGPVDVHRVIARIEALLSTPTAPSHLLIVVPLMGGSGAAPLLDADAIRSLLEASTRLRGLHVIVATDHLDRTAQDALESQVSTAIRISNSSSGRRATMVTTASTGDEPDSTVPFTPYVPPRLVTNRSIELRPAVIGRQHTPLERRLARAARRSSTDIDPGMDAVVDALCDAAATLDVEPPELIPAPLTTSIETGELFRSHQGDGVPIGLIDDVRDSLARPLWWEPGSGPLVLFGSRRSGVDAVITTVLSGIVDRFAPADVQVAAIETSERRRSALRTVEHVRAVAAPDSPQDMSALLDVVAEALGRDRTSPDDARLVLVVGDLALVRRELGSLEERFDELLAAAVGEDSGIDLVVYAGDRSTAGQLWHEGVPCLVGSSSDVAELSAFGIADLRPLEIVGRCRRFPGGELVQLASTSVPLEAILIGDEP